MGIWRLFFLSPVLLARSEVRNITRSISMLADQYSSCHYLSVRRDDLFFPGAVLLVIMQCHVYRHILSRLHPHPQDSSATLTARSFACPVDHSRTFFPMPAVPYLKASFKTATISVMLTAIAWFRFLSLILTMPVCKLALIPTSVTF